MCALASRSLYEDMSTKKLEQVIDDKKHLIHFLEEELDCCGMVDTSEYQRLERTLADTRVELNSLRMIMGQRNAERKAFKGFEVARTTPRECTIRYADQKDHMTCHLVDMRLIPIPQTKEANDALHMRMVPLDDEEGWCVITTIGRLVMAGVDIEHFGFHDDEADEELLSTEIVMFATDMWQEGGNPYYLWVRA